MSQAPALTGDPLPLHEDAGGVLRVGGTRVMLDVLVDAFDEGATAEEIAQQYPSLSLGDVYAVLGHVIRHRREVDDYLRRRGRERAVVRINNERRFAPQGVRARLLARRPAS
jgi:uncharacterized protein (DUF433 family)